MSKKHVEPIVTSSVKNSAASCDRSLFVILGRNAHYQVPILHHVFHKNRNEASSLWCYKDKATLKSLQKLLKSQNDEESCSSRKSKFEPNICSYNDFHKVSGQSYDFIVMSNFETFTPQLIASVISCLRKSGLLIIIMEKLNTLEQLCHFKMDLHDDYDIDLSQEFRSNFNERLAFLLHTSMNCIVLDDEMTVLSAPTHETVLQISDETDLAQFKEEHNMTDIYGVLVNQCQTLEQCKLVVQFLDTLKKKTPNSSTIVSSPIGCGKSAALGLAIAGSLALNYSNIFVSSLCFDNVKILFKFLFKGLDALGYKEDDDYDIIESVNPDFNKSLIGVNIFKDHPQAIRFIHPKDAKDKLQQAELVVIDEVSSIPLPLLKNLFGQHVILMSSTTKGYGAAGCSMLSDVMSNFGKSFDEGSQNAQRSSEFVSGRTLSKISLKEPVNHIVNDSLEQWLNRLLCFEISKPTSLSSGCPHPQQCKLYYVNRKSLFSCNPHSETFLQNLVSLFASCQRQNSVEQLIRMADAPDHHIFCLLAPTTNNKRTIPEILCALLVHIEQKLPQNITYSGTNERQPLSPCFSHWSQNVEMLKIPGIHVLDIVTHPEVQRMGYGLKAFQLLQEFYEEKFISLDEDMLCDQEDTSAKASLLLELTEVQPDKVDYFTVSYSLSSRLLSFWRKAGFSPVFLSKEHNSIDEHLCFMIKPFNNGLDNLRGVLSENWRAFREYFYVLLSFECKTFSPALAMSLLACHESFPKGLTKDDIDIYIRPHHMKLLERYSNSQGDLHSIMPIIPVLSKLYFRHCFKDLALPYVQQAIMLCMGLQRKMVDDIVKDLGLPSSQLHALLNRTIKRITKHLVEIIEQAVEKTVPVAAPVEPIAQDLDQELEEAAEKIVKQQLKDKKELKNVDFAQYAIKGSEEEWQNVLQSGRKTLISIKSIRKKSDDVGTPLRQSKKSFKHKNKRKSNKS